MPHICASFESSTVLFILQQKYGWIWEFTYGTKWLQMWHCADVFVEMALLFIPFFLYFDRRLWHWLHSFSSSWSTWGYTYVQFSFLFFVGFSCSICLVCACTGSRPCWLHDVNLCWAEKECMNIFDIPTSMTATHRPQRRLHLLEEQGWGSNNC